MKSGQTTLEVDIPLRREPLKLWYRFGVIDERKAGPGERVCDPRVLNDFSLHLQLSGSSWIWFDAVDGSLAVDPGEILFLPPGLAHAWAYVGETHLAVHFDLQYNPALTPHNYDGSYNMIRHLAGDVATPPVRTMPVFRLRFPGQESGEAWRIPLVTHLPNPGEWQRRLGDLVQRWETRTLESVLSQLRVHRTLGWALEELTVRADYNLHLAGDPRIAELLDRLGDPAVLAEVTKTPVTRLAQGLGMKETLFCKQFRIMTGHPPHRYFRERQMQLAMRLLRDTAIPVKQVARKTGFDDPYHFSRVFRSITGSAPIEYRNAKCRA